MKRVNHLDHSIDHFRERTRVAVPPGFRKGTLARLGDAIQVYPLGFSLGAIILAAGLAAVLSVFITGYGMAHHEEPPPPFLQNSPSGSWFSSR